MIAYLRSQLAVLNGDEPNTGFFFQHTAPNFTNNTDPSGKLFRMVKQEPEANEQKAPNNYLFKINQQSMISSIQMEEDQVEINLPRQMPIMP